MKLLYYFGDRFYQESGSFMGVLYSEHGVRYDWGYVQRDLAAGEGVTILPATPEMLAWAEETLRKMKG